MAQHSLFDTLRCFIDKDMQALISGHVQRRKSNMSLASYPGSQWAGNLLLTHQEPGYEAIL